MFNYETKIFFSQCDPAGVIFYGEVFTIAHECYERLLTDNNYEQELFQSDELAYPIVHTESNYFDPLRLHDNLSIQLRVEKIGNTSYTLNYKFISGDKLKAEVKTVHVCVARGSGAKNYLPERLIEILSAHVIDN
jgi:YbgC/YbaW family acyl-CoA thioester hydrolase